MLWLATAATAASATTAATTATTSAAAEEQTYLGLGFITTLLVVIWLIRRTRA